MQQNRAGPDKPKCITHTAKAATSDATSLDIRAIPQALSHIFVHLTTLKFSIFSTKQLRVLWPKPINNSRAGTKLCYLNSNLTNASKLNVSKLNAPKLNVSRPNASKLNVSKPNASKLNVSKPNASKLNVSKSNASKLNVLKPNALKLNASGERLKAECCKAKLKFGFNPLGFEVFGLEVFGFEALGYEVWGVQLWGVWLWDVQLGGIHCSL